MDISKRGFLAGLSSLLFVLVSTAFGRSKDIQDFPDYNHLEYAKPMPPPDQQVPAPPPGSIHMEVGGNKPVADDTSLEALPVSLRPTAVNDTSEPPMDFFDSGAAPSSAPVVSTTTPPTKS